MNRDSRQLPLFPPRPALPSPSRPFLSGSIKVITLTQPWATLVAISAKKFETRGWSTNHRGLLAIHAAKAFPVDCQELVKDPVFWAVLEGVPLPTGQIIATCELVECHRTEQIASTLDEQERLFGDYSEGRWAFELKNVRMLETAIRARGALGLWDFPPHGGLPSQPFALAPSPDEIRICSGCGKAIIVQRRTADGQVVSEFVSAAGACFQCAHPER